MKINESLSENLNNQSKINTELSKMLDIISSWLEWDRNNDNKTSEFIFYKPVFPYVSENFFKVIDVLKNNNIECFGYSSCFQGKDNKLVLFYKLIIPLKGEKYL